MRRQHRIRMFGTEHPTHEQVKAQDSALSSYRKRGLCTFVVVYEDGHPSELFFAGTTGD